ncbi:MAG: gliding motility-associated C-terminal domain-containing protein [Bacteroidales bacterium]|nr:gliding motility-associated C-terminal domain-containing protein [Bacteroidales bacterium]
MNDLKNIKEILSNYELEYNHQDWLKLEKDIPKPGMSGLVKGIIVASTVIISITAAILFINGINKSNNINNKNKITQTTPTNINTSEKIIVIDENSNIAKQNISEKNLATKKTEDTNHNQHSVQNTTEKKSVTSANDTQQNNSTNQNSIDKDNSKTTIIVEPIAESTTPDISKLVFSYELSENCIPATIKFKAKNVPKNCTIVWNTGDNYRIEGNEVEYTYTNDGSFYPEINVIYNNFVLKNEKIDIIELNSSTKIRINFDKSENSYYFTCDNEKGLDLLWSIDKLEFREREVRYDFNKSANYIIRLDAINEYGCKTSVEETIKILIEHVFYLPNAFTPNTNGINSEFGPIGEDMHFESYQLLIVDGTGKPVFSSNNFDYKWNGKINNVGENAKPGYYLWEIKTLDEYGNIQTKKGRVNLIWN